MSVSKCHAGINYLRPFTSIRGMLLVIAMLGIAAGAGHATAVAQTIIDNNGTGFAVSGAWTFNPSPNPTGYLTAIHHNGAAGGTGTKQATWTFSGLSAGNYQVSVTWTPKADRASNAPYVIFDNTTSVYATTLDQRNTPAADFVSGVNFQNLGAPVTINSGTLVVQLTDNANGYVIADAVRIECVP